MEREFYYIVRVMSVESNVTGKPYDHAEIAVEMEEARFMEGTVWNATTGTWEKFDETPEVEALSAKQYAQLMNLLDNANDERSRK